MIRAIASAAETRRSPGTRGPISTETVTSPEASSVVTKKWCVARSAAIWKVSVSSSSGCQRVSCASSASITVASSVSWGVSVIGLRSLGQSSADAAATSSTGSSPPNDTAMRTLT